MSFSDVSTVVKHFATANEGFTTTTNGQVLSSATTVGLNSVAGLTDGSVFVGVIEPAGTKEQVFTGTVDTGGAQITGVIWTKGTNVTHATGVSVVDYDTGTGFNMMRKGILVSHNQDGTLKDGAVDRTAALANNIVTSAKIVDGTIAYNDLLATIFSSQVTTTTGGAVGSFSYINLGGIKMLWGSFTGITTGSANTITLPTSFFSNVQSITTTPGDVSGTNQVYTYIDVVSNTSVTVGLGSIAGSGTFPVQLLIIGN